MPRLSTPEDASDYYETTHYPEVPPFYSEDNTFSEDITELIRSAIGKYLINH